MDTIIKISLPRGPYFYILLITVGGGHNLQNEYMAKTKNGRNIKRWKLDNSNEEAIIYKAGWLNHPSTQWVLQSAYNYIWLYKHMMALNEEYKLRYNHTKDHLTIQKLGEILNTPPTNMKNSNVNETEPTPAMPDYCKVKNDSVASYRKYCDN